MKEKQIRDLLSGGGHLVFLQKITEWAENGKSLPLTQQVNKARVWSTLDR